MTHHPTIKFDLRSKFHLKSRLAKLPLIAGLLVPLGACGEDDSIQDCAGSKCDVLVDFEDRLEGREDAIAKFLRTLDVDQQSEVDADFETFAAGVAEIQGCGVESWQSFVVSDRIVPNGSGEPFPRVVSTVCTGTKASEFFIAASFKDPNSDDVDITRLEMFAWDSTARQYRFYASEPVGPGRIEIEVDPERCTECHLTPSNLPSGGMRMTPIMNELTQPWSHWNSEVPMFNGNSDPFPNHDFIVPNGVRDGQNFTRIAKERIAAASDLEQIIRSGHDRVGLARTRDKRIVTEDWRPAMDLMRPLFCEEQLNYATEDFNSGDILVSALVPGGMHNAFRAVRSDWPWTWVNGDKVKIPAPEGVAAIAMIPVRGNADIGFENLLMVPEISAVFTPHQIVQIRALDWKRPALSEFRCGIWKDALARFEASDPRVPLSGKVPDTMRELYPQIMQIDGVAIDSGDAETIISLPLANASSIAALVGALGSGPLPGTCPTELDACEVDLDGLGEQLDAHVQTFVTGQADPVRVNLQQIRDDLICTLKGIFAAAPGLPEHSCDAGTQPDASFADQNDTEIAIDDNDAGGVTSAIEVRGSDEIAVVSVEVRVDVEHTWRGDLLIELTSAGGETKVVHAFESDDSDDGFSESFTVAGFSADDSRGEWTLRVIDRAAQDTGTLLGWSLGINTGAP